MTKSKTISERLSALSLTHSAYSANTGEREVVEIETGKRVGLMTAFEAIEFLESQQEEAT